MGLVINDWPHSTYLYITFKFQEDDSSQKVFLRS